jgi:HEAT repeats
MRSGIAFIVLLMSVFPARAVGAPSSIANARLEAASEASPAKALESIGRSATAEWVGWSVPAVPTAHGVCCFGKDAKNRGCSLADRDNSWGTSDTWKNDGSTVLYVLVEVKDGAPSRVRVVSSDCPVDGAQCRLVWLGPVDPAASIAALDRLLDTKGKKDALSEPTVAAIAYHESAGADAVLERRAFDRSLSKDSRKSAIFWAGVARREAGYRLLERVLSSEPEGELREHAVFALTQSSVPGACERIKRVAIEDRNNDVRAQALFWLAQTNAEGAGDWIVGRLDAEKDDHVREQAVFALSQLKDGTDRLLAVLRSKRDPETVRRALFWLGQSNDPRALEEIEKILDR